MKATFLSLHLRSLMTVCGQVSCSPPVWATAPRKEKAGASGNRPNRGMQVHLEQKGPGCDGNRDTFPKGGIKEFKWCVGNIMSPIEDPMVENK